MATQTLRAALLPLCLLLAAACGSTVPVSQQGMTTDGLGTTALTAPGTGGSGVGPVSTDGVLPTAAASAPAQTTQAAGAAVDGAPSGVTTVVGGTSPIYIGVPYADSQQANTMLGAIGKGLAGADVKAIYEALVADVNARGGIRGHQVKLVFYKIDITSNVPQEEQAACQAFTQDNHVLVAMGDASPAYSRCILKGGAAVVQSYFSDNIASQYAGLRYVYQPAGIPQDRLMPIYGRALKEMGYFDSVTPVKLGVLYEDLPAYHKAEELLEKQLDALGIKVEIKQAFAPVQSQSDIGANQSQVQGAVLRFRAAGVTHVIGVENNAWLIGFFGVGAASQGYYPRYGYDSNEVLSNVATNVPAEALKGSVFLGYYPPYDVLDTKQFTPEGQKCLALLVRKGIAVPDTGNGHSDSMTACDNVRFLEAALAAAPAGGEVTRDLLAAGVGALGSSYRSTITFSTRFTSGLGYITGVSAYRTGKWDETCSCFAYTSGLKPFG
jgi:ABC-type branched-subunit amino acid transport system substrate-binding protein